MLPHTRSILLQGLLGAMRQAAACGMGGTWVCCGSQQKIGFRHAACHQSVGYLPFERAGVCWKLFMPIQELLPFAVSRHAACSMALCACVGVPLCLCLCLCCDRFSGSGLSVVCVIIRCLGNTSVLTANHLGCLAPCGLLATQNVLRCFLGWPPPGVGICSDLISRHNKATKWYEVACGCSGHLHRPHQASGMYMGSTGAAASVLVSMHVTHGRVTAACTSSVRSGGGW